MLRYVDKTFHRDYCSVCVHHVGVCSSYHLQQARQINCNVERIILS